MVLSKKVVSAVVALALGAMTYGVAMAYGGARRGDGRDLFLLARAAGLTHAQIKTAFTSSKATLQTDRAAVQSARSTLDSCLVAGTDCTSQAANYLSAKQTADKDRLAIWQGLFKGNPDPQKASAVLQKMQQLQASRKQLFEQVRGSANGANNIAAE